MLNPLDSPHNVKIKKSEFIQDKKYYVDCIWCTYFVTALNVGRAMYSILPIHDPPVGIFGDVFHQYWCFKLFLTVTTDCIKTFS